MPIVHIDIIKRDIRKKRALVAALTEAVVSTLGVAPEGVWVVVNELETQQLAIGGELYADRAKKRPASAKKSITTKNKRVK